MAIKRKIRKAPTLEQIRLTMGTAIRELETIYLDDGNEPDQRVRAINSLASLANSYAKLTESADFEARLTELENNQMRKVS